MANLESQPVYHEEPELPPLPPATGYIPRFSRKRTIDEVLDNGSSDLPQFSSDDASSTIENYAFQRPKRLRQGPWWSASQEKAVSEAKAHTKQRNLTRNLDSGVWMASDSSFGEDELEITTQEASAPLATFPKSGTRKVFQVKDLPPLPRDDVSVSFTDKHREAAKKVERAIVKNDPSIDLTGMALGSLPWKILQPLTTFALEPKHRFESLYPRLEFFLAGNELSEVPPELWTLEGLAVVSLRTNMIKELPAGIAKLAPNLRHLNVNVNQLNYLPSDILTMVSPGDPQCFGLHIRDNPFYQPILNVATNEGASVKELTIESAKHIAISAKNRWVANSPVSAKKFIPLIKIPLKESIWTSRVAYLDITGQPINGPMPSKNQVALPYNQDIESRKTSKVGGKVPSLYELALRASTVYPIEQLLQHLETDAVPPRLLKNLQQVAKQSASAYQTCSICKRLFSVPRTEWMEWNLVVSKYTRPIPLLFHGCSWSCVPNTDHLLDAHKNCGWYPEDDDELYRGW